MRAGRRTLKGLIEIAPASATAARLSLARAIAFRWTRQGCDPRKHRVALNKETIRVLHDAYRGSDFVKRRLANLEALAARGPQARALNLTSITCLAQLGLMRSANFDFASEAPNIKGGCSGKPTWINAASHRTTSINLY